MMKHKNVKRSRYAFRSCDMEAKVPVRLQTGDVIVLGSTELEVHIDNLNCPSGGGSRENENSLE